MVSLFPEETFKNRANGLRPDLAQAIADLHPKFLRFPGGCITHGRGNDNAYRWKATIGDVAERTPNWNLWGYHQTYGLGFYEYFQFCEDINAIPLPVLPLGVSCQFRDREVVPLNEIQPWIDDALDLVEFANGDSTTTWGKKRAAMGHPQPFKMEYICLGNEEDDIPEFRERFKLIANALKEKYPEIKILGTSGTIGWGDYYNSLWDFSRQEELYAVDEHYYVDPTWLLANNNRYDSFDRNGPKVFIGEYASWDDRMNNAIAEAAYLTGVERNADVVQFTCYAPLLCNEKHNQWHPDLIRFNNKTVCKTVNYYVQQLYSTYAGNLYLNSNVSYDKGFDPFEHIFNGKVGLGSWKTQVQFDSVSLVSNKFSKLDEDFSTDPANWEVLNGTFSVSGDVYVQSSDAEPAWSLYNKPITESEYTYRVKAKKTGAPKVF
jgi:alpha-L-arabinofuranosidase